MASHLNMNDINEHCGHVTRSFPLWKKYITVHRVDFQKHNKEK